MKQVLLQEKFPVYTLSINKNETFFSSAQELVDYFKKLINDHKVARFLTEFNHYNHTKELDGGVIDESFIDARNIVFCFGTKLEKPEVMAVRPRSIGITESATGFVISFMEAPMAIANDTMEEWVKSVVKKDAA
ncbi:MAG: DUF6858 family protein [Thiotrichales bacterium]